MDQFVLWFNMISFTLMFASSGLVYIVYSRNRADWLRYYLVYSVAYAFWLLFATWAFFQQVYLDMPLPQLSRVFAWVRSAASIVIAIYGPLFFLRAAGVPGTRRVRVLVLIAAGVLLALILSFMLLVLPVLALAATMGFNAAFTALSWFAWARLRRGSGNPARPMMPVVAYSSVAYLVLAVLALTVPYLTPSGPTVYLNATASGAFVFGWALLATGMAMRWIGGGHVRETPVPPAFVNDYAITRRESEILSVLVEGKTSAEIGEQLFISQRTVEAHLYSVYRKCAVGNRVELLNKIASYRS